jgi:hypothetical protein
MINGTKKESRVVKPITTVANRLSSTTKRRISSSKIEAKNDGSTKTKIRKTVRKTIVVTIKCL